MQNKTCIEIIGEIGDLIKDANNNRTAQILEEAKFKELCKQLSELVGITELQALYFATIFSLNCNDKDATPRDIAEHIKLPLKEFPLMFKTLESLIDLGFVFKAENYVGRFDFILTPESKDAIFRGETPKQENLITDALGFGEKIELYEDHIKCRRITISQAVTYYKRIASKNPALNISTVLLNKDYRDEEIILLTHMYYNYLNRDFQINYMEATSELFRGYRERNYIKKCIMNKSSSIFKNKIVEFDGDNYESRDLLRFSEDGKKLLFGSEYTQLNNENIIIKEGLLFPDDIPTVKIHLNQHEQKQIKTLSNALKDNNYAAIIKALNEKNLSAGVCALFYGTPGTGKTESVFQIAKRTNRAIKKVDLSSIKDKYVGESEKRIRNVFLNYHRICKSMDRPPILLLNEADGIFGRRIKINSSIDQMNNTIQNIILEEMENFKGILIATTNLQYNLDNAFERRFLFKIKFTPPTTDTLKKIISDKIPALSTLEVAELADKYKLTGGQLANVSRKLVFDEILYNIPVTKNRIEIYFQSEIESISQQVKHNKIIGFVVKKENQGYETE
jgi:hypothetical protein